MDTLRGPGVTSFMIPRLSQFSRPKMLGSLRMLSLPRGDKVRDFVFEEECVTLPTITIDNYQTSIPDIVQEANSDQDNVEEPPVQNQEIFTENKLYTLKNHCH